MHHNRRAASEMSSNIRLSSWPFRHVPQQKVQQRSEHMYNIRLQVGAGSCVLMSASLPHFERGNRARAWQVCIST